MLLTLVTVYALAATGFSILSLRKNLEYMDRLDEVDDLVQDALQVLEEQHQKIDAKTKIEVFSDEPVVRELVQDISNARDAVLKVAGLLDSAVEYEEEEESENQET